MKQAVPETFTSCFRSCERKRGGKKDRGEVTGGRTRNFFPLCPCLLTCWCSQKFRTVGEPLLRGGCSDCIIVLRFSKALDLAFRGELSFCCGAIGNKDLRLFHAWVAL